MCTGVEIALLASAGASAGMSVMSGMQQKEMNKFQAEQAEADAVTAKGEAQVRAEKIREQAKAQAAAARAALAASGVSLDSQSASLINKDIISRGEEDAFTGIDDSLDMASRLRASAKTLRTAGKQAMVAGIANAGSTALSTYAGYKSGWYGSPQGTT